MDNILLVLLLLIMTGGISASVIFVLNKMPSESEKTRKEDETTTSIVDGKLYTISKTNSYIGHDFDTSRGKGKMCDAKVTQNSDAAAFKFIKDGDTWIVSTDCDGDGNYTSFLNGTKDLI